MNGQQLFKEIGKIDNKYLEKVDNQVVKRIKYKKVFLLAALFCTMGTIISMGAIVARKHNNQSNISVSATQKTYADYSSLQEAVEGLGFAPKFPEEFSNGMLFKEGQTVTIEDIGNQNTVTARFPMVMISYCLENRTVILNCEPLEEGYVAPQSDIKIVEYNGHELYVDSGKVLLVPQNINDDELKTILVNEQNRGMVLVRNDSVLQPSIRYGCKILWVENGVLYTLVNLVDNKKDLTDETEMVAMVQEIID